jgi:predicted N-acetyltransferase YhbS
VRAIVVRRRSRRGGRRADWLAARRDSGRRHGCALSVTSFSARRSAGPVTLVRSLGVQHVIEAAHPAYDHFLVWMFAVSPAQQRRALGRRQMREALAKADSAEVPAYLWTGNPDNLPYYRSHGFEVIGEARIPGGVPNWFMERAPCRPGPAEQPGSR